MNEGIPIKRPALFRRVAELTDKLFDLLVLRSSSEVAMSSSACWFETGSGAFTTVDRIVLAVSVVIDQGAGRAFAVVLCAVGFHRVIPRSKSQ